MSGQVSLSEVMYLVGPDSLHPGSLEKSHELARSCGVNRDTNVLDAGCGKGTTAIHLAGEYMCNVVGIDSSQRMIDYATARAKKRGVEDEATFQVASAYNLPFSSEFDIVLAEGTLSLLTKKVAMPELVNALKTGGKLGVLDFFWKQEPSPKLAGQLRRGWDGFSTLSLQQWRDLYKRSDLSVTKVSDFTQDVGGLEEHFKNELGIVGVAKLLGSVAIRPSLVSTLRQYRQLMSEAEGYLGYMYLVGEKV